MTRNAALSEAVDALTAARRSRCLLDALPRSARPADKAEAHAIQNEVARRIGPVTASLIAATVADISRFKSARQFAAWLGLVPRQNSTAGKTRLGRMGSPDDLFKIVR